MVRHITERAAKGAAVLIASHEFEIVDLLSPRVAVLDEGILLGTVSSANSSTREVYRQTLNHNAKESMRIVEQGKERKEA